MKKYILFASILLILQSLSHAQQLKGFVFELENGDKKPLPGASVVQLNTTNGTTTESDGSFQLKLRAAEPKSLVVSFVSYENDTIAVSDDYSNLLNIVLSDIKNLDEVQVVSRQKGSFMSRVETRNIVTISSAELQKAACCNLSESFENSAAVDVSYSDAVTGSKQIQMLGLAGNYTQLLTEVIPNYRGLATPFSLGYVPGSWMSSIQVSKGTSSVTSGYESMAGQINIEFKKPEAGELLFVNLYGNHEGKFEANFNGRVAINDRWSTMILAHYETLSVKHDLNNDGFLDMPLVNQINLFNRWKYKGDQLRMQFGFKYLNEDRLGGQSTFDNSKPNDLENAYGIHVQTNRYEGFLKIGYIFEHRVETSIGFQNQFILHEQESFFGLNDYNADQWSYYGNLMYQSFVGDKRHQVISGVSWSVDQYNEQLNDSVFSRHESVPGAFLQYTYCNSNNLNVILGLRVDNNNLFGFLFTPRLHAKYNINESTTARLSVGRGYRSANVIAENTSLLATSRTIQVMEPLKIESSWNYGISFSKHFNISARELSLVADYFRTDFNNQIIVDRENDPRFIRVSNLDGQSYSNNFQIEASYEPIKFFEVTLAFRYTDVKTTINKVLVEKPLANKYKGLLSISYQSRGKKWQVDLNTQLNGDQRLPYTDMQTIAFETEERSPVYAIVNTQITRYLGKWDLYIGGENLTNYKQNDPILAADDPFGDQFDASVIWGPISGIKIYGGIRFTINPKEE